MRQKAPHRAPEDVYSLRASVNGWKNLVQAAGLKHHWKFFLPLLKNEIWLHPQPLAEEKIPLGFSKIGGKPDLPDDIPWPVDGSGQSLSFVAQINCRHVSYFLQTKDLPNRGILYFFYSACQEGWGFSPNDRNTFRVIYSAHAGKLAPREFPVDVPGAARFLPLPVKFSRQLGLPRDLPDSLQPNGGGLSHAEWHVYDDRITQHKYTNKLLGHPYPIQGPMEEACALASSGMYTENGAPCHDPRGENLQDAAKDWQLLLQIDSNQEAGMMWGDMGMLYFWIRKQDLKKRAFDRCWMMLQCG